MTLTVTALSPAIGAEVTGVDLRDAADPELAADLRAALLEHLVLCFPGQHLDDDEHLRVASVWGRPNAADGMPPVIRLEDGPDSPPKADLWHTDAAHLAEPPDVAVLAMLECPPAGGDTLWASLYAVHDALSPAMQEVVAGLRLDVRPALPSVSADGRRIAYRPDASAPGLTHPLVRVHPETGRRALFLCGEYLLGIAGMDPAESDAFVALLRRGLDDPHVQCRWRWREGDVVVWDERCTNHRALSDHHPARRVVRRCTAGGSRPVGPGGDG